MTKENILRTFITSIWNDKCFDLIAEFVDASYRIHLDTDDPWEGLILNHDDFIERLNFSFNSFPDMHFEITSAIEETRHVAITWILTGTNRGKIGDNPPTNKKIETEGMTIYHFNGKLISGHTQVFNRVKVAKQLGYL